MPRGARWGKAVAAMGLEFGRRMGARMRTARALDAMWASRGFPGKA